MSSRQALRSGKKKSEESAQQLKEKTLGYLMMIIRSGTVITQKLNSNFQLNLKLVPLLLLAFCQHQTVVS